MQMHSEQEAVPSEHNSVHCDVYQDRAELIAELCMPGICVDVFAIGICM